MNLKKDYSGIFLQRNTKLSKYTYTGIFLYLIYLRCVRKIITLRVILVLLRTLLVFFLLMVVSDSQKICKDFRSIREKMEAISHYFLAMGHCIFILARAEKFISEPNMLIVKYF